MTHGVNYFKLPQNPQSTKSVFDKKKQEVENIISIIVVDLFGCLGRGRPCCCAVECA